MKDLSPAARELVDAHRTDRALTPADRRRIKHDLMLRVAALGATTAVATEVGAEIAAKVGATAAAKAAGVSLASKVAVVALSVTALTGVVSVSVWALRALSLSNRTPSATGPMPAPTFAAPATAPARAAMASRAVVAVPARALARTPAATPRVAVTAAASSETIDSTHRDHVKTIDEPAETPAPAATVVAPTDPEPELRALREARDDLRAGRPASAYRRLDDFDRQRGGGMLAEERSALKAIALCQWQPGPQARAGAAAFLRSSPESPLAIRVRSACAQ